MRRASLVRPLPWSAVFVLAALACLAFAGAAGSDPGPGPLGQPQRDNGHGHWFAHSCAQVPTGQAACGAQVVTNSSGVPLAGGAPPASVYGPAQFHGAYNLPTGGSTKTIAIVDAYDDPNAASDLAAYDAAYGLTDLKAYGSGSPWFRKVNQSGGTTPPAGNTGWGLEIALDIETAHEICQSCNVLLVEASSNSFDDLGTAENEAAALGASVISNSWGGSEFSTETSYDSYFNHPGIVITASTGDGGYGVEYPAASQYVVGVGGTSLSVTGSNGYGGEKAWSGAGSGCSRYEPKPSWQHDTGCSKHTVADVSADADPNTGAAVYDSYGYSGWYQVGGTSLASPLIAAVFALSGNTSNGAAPYSNPGALNDVVGGSNGSCGTATYLCTAVAGYDGPTGLGTPNGLTAFSGAPASPDFSFSATPSSQAVTQGQTATYTVAMTPTGGFSSSVSVSVAGAPGSPTGCTLTASTQSCSIMVPTSSSTSPGTYSLTFTGTGGGMTHTADASLTVNAPAASDFSLSISPSNPTLFTPGHVSYTVTVNRLNGFTGSFTLSVSGLPSGLTGSFGTNPTSSTSMLTLTASKRFPRQTYTFTVTGTSGSLTHTTTGRISTR
jgi:subtilase family serine protease